NEVKKFDKLKLDIKTHRARMNKEDLDVKFKDSRDPLRIVFVCAMWMTGFDVPSCGAVYLDKPMRNHTLMQTIARTNRVYVGKESGIVVDYIGVFRDLRRALAIYSKGVDKRDTPVQPKRVQIEGLEKLIDEACGFARGCGVDVLGVREGEGFARLAHMGEA